MERNRAGTWSSSNQKARGDNSRHGFGHGLSHLLSFSGVPLAQKDRSETDLSSKSFRDTIARRATSFTTRHFPSRLPCDLEGFGGYTPVDLSAYSTAGNLF